MGKKFAEMKTDEFSLKQIKIDEKNKEFIKHQVSENSVLNNKNDNNIHDLNQKKL